MNRITDKMLDKLAERLNKVTGSPETPYTRLDDGQLRANVGNFHISHAYGGVCLHRMSNESGGVATPIATGHVPKRELWDRVHAYLDGIEFAQREMGR